MSMMSVGLELLRADKARHVRWVCIRRVAAVVTTLAAIAAGVALVMDGSTALPLAIAVTVSLIGAVALVVATYGAARAREACKQRANAILRTFEPLPD